MDNAPRPPAGEPRCENVRDSVVRNPSWAPDGSAVAYEDKDGIWVQRVPDLTSPNCAGMSETLLVAGGQHADWGPADVVVPQKPVPPGTGSVPGGPAGGQDQAARPSPLRSVVVPRRASRRRGLTIKLTMSAPARVTISVCRRTRGTCVGPVVRTAIRARAGTSKAVLSLRRLKAGRYTVRVAPAGGPTVMRSVRVR
jgi:hypothetical protein